MKHLHIKISYPCMFSCLVNKVHQLRRSFWLYYPYYFSKTFEYNDKVPATHLVQKQSSFKAALHSSSKGKDWEKWMHYEKCIVKNSTLTSFSFIQVAVDAFSSTDNLKCNITHVMETRTLNPNSNLKPLILTTKSLIGYVSKYFS